MNLITLVQIARQLWIVWLVVLLAGIVLWVYWPRRRPIYDRASRIPLDDDVKV
jgi:cbb3-type cytochrome oxidase subunit 3